ncbi:MAG: autotransporter domain-containing protein [Campylobacterales bacterium]|nr:autotransporter domain-containing protein [Campylobacterales bacterium]
MSGTGALNKSGAGILTLSGTNTYSGATTINAGTLAVTGDTSSSSFTVNSGATLSGNGTVGSTTVANGGSLAPTAISTLSVAGNLIMDAGSTLKVNAYADGTNPKVSATGTATINGGNVNVIANNAGTWNNSTVYTVVSATGGVTGTFASVTDNLAFLDPTLSYESGAVKLTLARNDVSYVSVVVPPTIVTPPVVTPEPIPPPVIVTPTPPPVIVTPTPVVTPPVVVPEPVVTPTPAPTPPPVVTPEPTPTPPLLTFATLNALEVARVLDNAQGTSNAPMQQLYTTLNSMSAQQAREAIAQLGGTPLGSLSHQSNAQVGNFSTSLFSRMAGSGGGGIGLASLAFADNGGWASTFHYLADAGAIGINGFVEPQKVGDIEFWVRAVGGKTLTDGDTTRNISKSTTSTGGVQTGMDKKMDEWIVGGSFGYLKSDMQQTGLDGIINSYQGGAYVSQDTKSYRLSLNAIVGKYATTTSRNTPTGMANADYDGLSLSTEIKAAYKYTLSKSLTLEPTIGGWIQQYTQDNYSEHGASGANLSIDKATFASQALTTELKIINSFGDNKNDKKTLEASVGYIRESGDTNAPLSGRFSAAPTAGSFSIASANRGQDVLTATVGGDITIAKYTKLFALVNANKRENEEGYTAMAGVKVGF